MNKEVKKQVLKKINCLKLSKRNRSKQYLMEVTKKLLNRKKHLKKLFRLQKTMESKMIR